MNDVYSVSIIETNAYNKPAKGARTVLHFIAATEDSATETGAGIAALRLFARRGPDEPFIPRGLYQSHPAYVAGREAFLYGGPRDASAFRPSVDQYAYEAGWEHERWDAAAASGTA